MELKRDTVSAIPYEDQRFDKVCTVNTIYFWPEPERNAAQIYRVTPSGGTAVICFRGEPPALSMSEPKLARCRWYGRFAWSRASR